ncbi:major facilitator superfamily transporter [Ceratobasidium sp. AG-Ba]|nr:major facilitator superfamily transporter [Ceratobasidium sp. AG-Ba]QRV99516.1 major facilitator superfamily transporter [Ceratobasidium sp. AG-Ba]QRW14025.1 major facilitator superfamily transporter [Ceratobasidium sp. AG-Ba]
MRLRVAQTFNGIAVASGPFIAAKYFFTRENATTLTSVQWVYLAAAFGLCMALVLVLLHLPEPEIAEDGPECSETNGYFFQQRRLWFGWLCQFLYVGSQVTIFSFFINYGVEAAGYSDAKSSTFFSYSLILFTIGRVFGIIVLSVFPMELILSLWALFCALFITLAIFLPSTAGLASLMLVFFFEGLLVPAVFISATKNLGKHTKRAPAVIVSDVAGGAVSPPIQGAIADAKSTKIGFSICIPAYVYAAAFGGLLWWQRGARVFLRHEERGFDVQSKATPGNPEHVDKRGDFIADETKVLGFMRDGTSGLESELPALLQGRRSRTSVNL